MTASRGHPPPYRTEEGMEGRRGFVDTGRSDREGESRGGGGRREREGG